MKQLKSFMALNINGGDRISFHFDEIDNDTGEPTSVNNVGNFYVTSSDIRSHLEAIRDYIREHKLSE